MKIVLIVLFAFGICALSCSKRMEQKVSDSIVEVTDSTFYLKATNFEAIVFKPSFRWRSLESDHDLIDYPILIMVPEENILPWLPSIDAIKSFDKSFREYWKKANTDSLAQINDLVFIPYRNINDLQYQIVGFVDFDNAQKLSVDLFTGLTTSDGWRERPIIINDNKFARTLIYNVKKDSIEKVLIMY